MPRASAHRSVTVAASLLAALAGCVAAEKPAVIRPEAIATARQRADAAAERLTTTLMSRLAMALREGGPPRALHLCAEVAQEVTREVGRGEGLAIRRTSLRVRNPANAPDAFERAWLERTAAAIAAGRAAEPVYTVVASGPAPPVLRHLRPIVFPGGPCAHCHGTANEIDPAVAALLRERYPEDRATGFVPGELRGAISVTVPLADPARDDVSHGGPGSQRQSVETSGQRHY